MQVAGLRPNPPESPHGLPQWCGHRHLLLRYVSDLVHAELVHLRRGRAGVPPLPWTGETRLEAGLGVDSLERHALATALAQRLDPLHANSGNDLPVAATLNGYCDSMGETGAMLGFKTSGSTGVAKTCVHRLDLLWEESRFFAAQLPPAPRILYLIPAHHVYGFLFSVLLPLACRLDETALVDARRMLPADLARQARGGDVILGYPEFWCAVAAAGLRWPPGVTGVTSTAPLPAEVARQLAEAGLQLLEIYGSSETAGVGWRTDARAPYALLPYWQRTGGADELVRMTTDGVPIAGICQDRIDWRDERSFIPGKRLDHAVQVGGVNVYPAHVADLLRGHPAVADVQVRLMRADEGSRLKAFVVAADPAGMTGLPAQLASWARDRLPAAARPVSYTVGASMPVNSQGKLADWIITDAGVDDRAQESLYR